MKTRQKNSWVSRTFSMPPIRAFSAEISVILLFRGLPDSDNHFVKGPRLRPAAACGSYRTCGCPERAHKVLGRPPRNAVFHRYPRQPLLFFEEDGREQTQLDGRFDPQILRTNHHETNEYYRNIVDHRDAPL